MARISNEKILNQARDYFSKAEYKKALDKFAKVLQNDPDSKEAYNGVILSEMALSGESGAEALFDYYEILKSENDKEADEIMSDILKNMDGTLEQITKLFLEPLKEKLEEEEGILYDDFKKLVEESGDFKTTFENIMFSTKVIITKKEDFLEFLDNLINFGYDEMALSYLENALTFHPQDESFRNLFKKLAKKEGIVFED